MEKKTPVMAHVSMFFACAFWGLMAPLGKDAMTHGVTGVDMVTFRVTGAMILFWITSSIAPKEHVPLRDIGMFFFAGLFGLVFNQCCYTIGLSLTSPINSSIVTTSMPIFAMFLSAIILKEPLSGKKVGGVMLGFCGAIILIMTSVSSVSDKVGDIRGDILCLFAQFSFALYLALFNPLIKKYSVFTINKWMFTYATICILPFTFKHVASIDYASLSPQTWLETAFVVCIGTFFSYILTMYSQRILRPTVVSVYNYVQPMVAVVVSVLTGIGIFRWTHAVAVILVFTGVRLVTKSKSRKDLATPPPRTPETKSRPVQW